MRVPLEAVLIFPKGLPGPGSPLTTIRGWLGQWGLLAVLS